MAWNERESNSKSLSGALFPHARCVAPGRLVRFTAQMALATRKKVAIAQRSRLTTVAAVDPAPAVLYKLYVAYLSCGTGNEWMAVPPLRYTL